MNASTTQMFVERIRDAKIISDLTHVLVTPASLALDLGTAKVSNDF